MAPQALHIPTGDPDQHIVVAGKKVKQRSVVVNGRTYMVPAGITRNQYNGWTLVLKRKGMVLVTEQFADGTYNGLTAHSLTHAINRLIEVLEEYERSQQ